MIQTQVRSNPDKDKKVYVPGRYPGHIIQWKPKALFDDGAGNWTVEDLTSDNYELAAAIFYDVKVKIAPEAEKATVEYNGKKYSGKNMVGLEITQARRALPALNMGNTNKDRASNVKYVEFLEKLNITVPKENDEYILPILEEKDMFGLPVIVDVDFQKDKDGNQYLKVYDMVYWKNGKPKTKEEFEEEDLPF